LTLKGTKYVPSGITGTTPTFGDVNSTVALVNGASINVSDVDSKIYSVTMPEAIYW
jgi:hypothetical protein